MVFPSQYPIQKAMEEAGITPGANIPTHPSDELVKRHASLPLTHQPGAKWMYHSGSDIAGVLIARVTGQTLEPFLRERIFVPLGMKHTAFSVPEAKLDRLATFYHADAETRRLGAFDEARGGRFVRSPIFESGGAGLVATVDDLLAFGRMMLNQGKYGHERILSRLSVELMTTDTSPPNRRWCPSSSPASGTTAAGASACP